MKERTDTGQIQLQPAEPQGPLQVEIEGDKGQVKATGGRNGQTIRDAHLAVHEDAWTVVWHLAIRVLRVLISMVGGAMGGSYVGIVSGCFAAVVFDRGVGVVVGCAFLGALAGAVICGLWDWMSDG